MLKNMPANVGDIRDAGSIPGLGRSPAGGDGNLFEYSCLENPKDRGVWRATVHGVAEPDTTAHAQAEFLGLCCGCSVAKSRPTLCVPMDFSMPGFRVLHYLPEFAQNS